jgi:hypothetical protein
VIDPPKKIICLDFFSVWKSLVVQDGIGYRRYKVPELARRKDKRRREKVRMKHVLWRKGSEFAEY